MQKILKTFFSSILLSLHSLHITSTLNSFSSYNNLTSTFLFSRFTKSESSLNKVKRSRNAAFFYDYELVGDDFFLNIAHLDCKQKLDYITSARGYRGILDGIAA